MNDFRRTATRTRAMDGARGGTQPPSLDHDELSRLEDLARMTEREIAQPPQPGALAIASRICSGVRSR